MSTATLDEPATVIDRRSTAGADTLAASIVIMLTMTVVQRLVGFGRGVLFCRWLGPEELGQWDVAFGFLNLAAPLVVLGLPGSFGRYVEHFRRRGQFSTFLKRTSVLSLASCTVCVVAIVAARDWFSRLIFGSAEHADLVVVLAICLATVVLNNSLSALFVAVRMYRVVSLLQFVQSFGFAAVSLTLLLIWPQGAASVIVGYAVATLLASSLAVFWFRPLSLDEPPSAAPTAPAEFWSKVLPFAAWMWLTNLLANLFEVIDRYMIVHHGGMSPDEALRQVGFYHSSRLVPLLFVGVMGLLGSMVTPHLTHDWEAGRRESVVRRLNMMLKVLMIALLAASVGVLFFAPWLFHFAFQDKFQGGLVVLPWTLAYCAWFGTIAVAQNYLWCAEHARLGSLALLAGLLVNIGCNSYLLPRYGLEGAVWATTVANLVALLLTYEFSRRHGMRIDRGTWLLSLAPACLGLGVWFALGTLMFIVLAVVAGDQLLTRAEKEQLGEKVNRALQRVRCGGASAALAATKATN